MKGRAKTAAAVILAAVCVIGCVSGCAADETDEAEALALYEERGTVTSDGIVYYAEEAGLELEVTPYAAEISVASAEATASSTIYVTATPSGDSAVLMPGDATGTVTWTLAWADGASEWASGKSVGDYVTVKSYTSQMGQILFWEEFGEQVILTAKYGTLSATCTLDCLKYEFTYQRNSDGSTYSITGCTERETYSLSDFRIPNQYNSMKVTGIADSPEWSFEALYVDVYLTGSLTTVGAYAFYGIEFGTNVTVYIGSNVSYIGMGAFYEDYRRAASMIDFSASEKSWTATYDSSGEAVSLGYLYMQSPTVCATYLTSTYKDHYIFTGE